MNVDFGPGSSQPAAHDLATGKGVKIAVFPDGLDPNIPNFMRGGVSAIFDYQDFSGEGVAAQTGAAEAFGDASTPFLGDFCADGGNAGAGLCSTYKLFDAEVARIHLGFTADVIREVDGVRRRAMNRRSMQ